MKDAKHWAKELADKSGLKIGTVYNITYKLGRKPTLKELKNRPGCGRPSKY